MNTPGGSRISFGGGANGSGEGEALLPALSSLASQLSCALVTWEGVARSQQQPSRVLKWASGSNSSM